MEYHAIQVLLAPGNTWHTSIIQMFENPDPRIESRGFLKKMVKTC